MNNKTPSRKARLLTKCLLASLVLHSTALYFFIRHPITIQDMKDSFFQKNKPLAKNVYGEDTYDPSDTTLDEFFEEFSLQSPLLYVKRLEEPALQKPLPIESKEEILTSSSVLHTLDTTAQDDSSLQPLSFVFKPEEPLPLFAAEAPNVAEKEIKRAPATLQSPKDLLPLEELFAYAPLIDDRVSIEKDLREEPFTPVEEYTETLPEPLATSPSLDMAINSPKASGSYTLVPRELEIPLLEKPSYHFAPTDSSKQIYRQKGLREIDDYLPTKVIYSLKWNDNFDIRPSFFPDGDGYVFSITVTPTHNLESERIKQNTYFLIDTSSEIENHKVTVFKKSVLKALRSLQEGDFFNIVLLDKRIEKLSPHNLQVSLQNVRLAEEFLEKKQDKPFFASFDLFQGLLDTLKWIPEDNEVHTAIVLTNGKLSSSLSSTKEEINTLLEKNESKINLFAVAAGKNNNIVSLDMLSSLFGGKLLYSDTNASLPRKLSTFVKNLHSPLIKDISISLQTADPKAEISILPLHAKTPNLYQKEPFIIMGRTNRLSPLILTLEGRNDEDWVVLQKELNFEQAEEAPNSLKKEWELRQASISYGKFLEEAKAVHLKEAKEVLKVVHGKAAFE